MRRDANGKTIRAVRPNAGIEAAYRRALDALIARMHRSVSYWLKAAYRTNPPEMAQDADPPIAEAKFMGGPIWFEEGTKQWAAYVNGVPLFGKGGAIRLFKTEGAALRAAKMEAGLYLPADELTEAMNDLAADWQTRFDAAAPKLARWFSEEAEERSSAQMRSILRKSGISVRFQMTPAQEDVLEATVEQNVGLIKSISSEYLTDVQGMVMRSVQTGRDLGSLTAQLEQRYGITRRRAALIARDQNNKATSAMQRARQTELGITEAIWQHSRGGKHPRPKHVRADGKVYDVKKGLPIGDRGQYVFPGEEINCRCVSRSVLPGFP